MVRWNKSGTKNIDYRYVRSPWAIAEVPLGVAFCVPFFFQVLVVAGKGFSEMMKFQIEIIQSELA